MANIDEIYRDLTGVDIETQRLLWDERGKGYYGEYLVFKKLYPELTGCCKILMNLQIPTGDGKTTEIDLLLIHETGLYVFEMKHYKGTIYGKASDQKWTQYFRTAPNSRFYNPILQNQYHIKALQRMFPSIPIHSLIVFTSPECDLRVECNELDITVCQLGNLYIPLHLLETRSKLFDINRIDSIFNELVSFSPITTKPVTVEGETIPFHQYINTIVKDFHNEKDNVKNAFLTAEKTERKKTIATITAAAIAIVVCIALSIFACSQYRTYADGQIAAAEQELSEFAQKFEHVEEFNSGDVVISSSLITVSNISIENATDIADTVNFSCTLTWNGADYGIQLAKDSKYIVILKDGSVKEYDLFNSTFKYYPTYRIGKGAYNKYNLPVCEFYKVDVADVAYIKLTNLKIWKYLTNYGNPLFEGYEIELYRAE